MLEKCQRKATLSAIIIVPAIMSLIFHFLYILLRNVKFFLSATSLYVRPFAWTTTQVSMVPFIYFRTYFMVPLTSSAVIISISHLIPLFTNDFQMYNSYLKVGRQYLKPPGYRLPSPWVHYLALNPHALRMPPLGQQLFMLCPQAQYKFAPDSL